MTTVTINPAWRISVGKDEDGSWTAALSIALDPNEVAPQVLQLAWNKSGFADERAAIGEAREVAAEADSAHAAQFGGGA